MSRRSIGKEERERIRMKFGGLCSYCGTALDKSFHVDHLVPIEHAHLHLHLRDDANIDSNLVPSCRSCNNFKGVFELEEFRRELAAQVERARKYSVNFRNAERFGLIQVFDAQHIKFHFEDTLP